MNGLLSSSIMIFGIALTIILYVKGYKGKEAFNNNLTAYALNGNTKFKWLHWFKFILPLGILNETMTLVNIFNSIPEESFGAVSTYVAIILVFYAVYIFMVAYTYLGLLQLKKSGYISVRYWFFINWGVMALMTFVLQLNSDITSVLASLTGTLISTAIIGIPHMIYIKKRKFLFTN